MSDTEETDIPRRSVLGAVAGALALSGCTGRAETDETTRTEISTPTDQPTSTAENDIDVSDVDLPETVNVGDPLTLDLVVENPSGEAFMMSWGVRVIDTKAGEGWARTFQVNGEKGETSVEETIEVEWGTDHETELLVEPGAASVSFLGGEGYEQETEFHRVEVVSNA